MASLANFAETVCQFRDHYKITTLIETGTHRGASAIWASSRFANVITIEKNPTTYREAVVNCMPYKNIQCLFGPSETILPNAISSINTGAFFWLDAHNEKGLFGPGADECPLMHELVDICEREWNNVILIDDSHYFKPPWNEAIWPRLERILELAHDFDYEVYTSRNALLLIPLVDGGLASNTEWSRL